ncbi:MAG: alanine--glyoxylate aminotransferase family protein [Halobacteriales archaeon]
MTPDRDRLLMTPGPTALPPEVREALARPIHNPDVEPEFARYYRGVLSKLADAYGTDDDVVILGGEGILGLEAAVESLVAPGDEVLCLANGLYGEGFADFVTGAGGEPVTHSVAPDEAFDPETVARVVDEHEFAVATMVHCETPTGVLNDLGPVLDVLDDAGVPTVVDAVSSLGGTPVPTGKIDVCLCASQKCLSSPPGLATASISDDAWAKVEATDAGGFYTGFGPWRDPDLSGETLPPFPYTHLVSNLYALEASLDRLLEEGLDAAHERHERAAERCRERGREIGLEPYPPGDLASPTVTAFEVTDAPALQRRLREDHGVVLSTGLGEFADDIIRVGHMGYGADPDRVDRAMDALADAL